LFTYLIAFIFYRGGILQGILGGALMGLCLYCIFVFGIAYVRPWFYIFKGSTFLLSNILFGALAGFIYEIFEVENFEEKVKV